MNKLSITLPDGSQICIESDDAGLVREVLYSFMSQLTGSNGAAPDAHVTKPVEPPVHSNGHAASNGSARHAAEPQRAPVVVAAENNGVPHGRAGHCRRPDGSAPAGARPRRGCEQ